MRPSIALLTLMPGRRSKVGIKVSVGINSRAVVGKRLSSCPVLSPHSVVSPAVDVPVRVCHRKDVEVEGIEKVALWLHRVGILDECVDCMEASRGRNPLSGV